jgi:hypothetical protein
MGEQLAIGIFEVAERIAEPLALVAFVCALAAYGYRYWLAERRKLIETAPEEERARVLEHTIRGFSTVSLDNLTRQQRVDLATKLIEERKFKMQWLSGAALAFAVILGVFIWLVGAPAADTGSFTVRLHGPGGPGDLITTGRVLLDVGAERKTQDVGPDGQVTFQNVPISQVQEAGITLVPQIAGYTPVSETRLPAVPPEGVYYLEMHPDSTRVMGTVLTRPPARKPVPGVELIFGSGLGTATTNRDGHYEVTIPRPPGSRVALRAIKDGVTGYDDYITLPESHALDIFFRAEG